MNAIVDKSEIENAIQEINGVIMEFTDPVNSLTGVKNLLYKLLEDSAKKENPDWAASGHCHCPDWTDIPYDKRCPECNIG
jgi:hypothetical protein